MPVWHDATRKLREEGELQLVGIIQEQHPDRCKLFMQWKQMDWPVLVDPLNLLEVSVVPIALLIDEQGILREALRDPRNAEERLTANLNEAKPTTSKPATSKADYSATLRRVNEALLLTDKPCFDEALRLVDEALRENGDDGALHFARGVAYRMRYDSAQRDNGDFATAVASWQRALDQNPNQYIWRRRIQQYGPRLDKPYPFYDWVEQARREIRARGEMPVALAVEPTGAELAAPVREFERRTTPMREPDPDGRVTRDEALILAAITVIPPRIRPGQAARVHIVFRPNLKANGHWNNEAEPLRVCVNPPDGFTCDRRLVTLSRPEQAVSDEPRTVEFELRAPTDARPGILLVPASALYNVCEGESGACLFRRRDLSIRVEIDASAP